MATNNAWNSQNPAQVALGGTGQSTLLIHGVLVGNTVAGITSLAVGTSGQVLLGSSAADPVFGTIGSSDGSISFTTGAGTLTIQGTAATTSQPGTLTLATNAETIAGSVTTKAVTPDDLKAKLGTQTVHGVLVGGGATAAVTALAVGTSGQVLLGSSAADPVFATLTSSGGTIAFTTGAGTLNIDTVASGDAWAVITADQTAVVNNGYICNKGTVLTLTLPATAVVGNLIEVTGINTALGWKIAQNANQIIHFGTSNTTTGVGGSLASTAIRDSIKIVCVVAGASTEWNVISSIGNITVV